MTSATAGPARSPWPVVLWVLAVLLAVAGALATLWRPTAPELGPVDTTLTSFPAATLRQVAAWVGPVRAAFVLRLLVTVAVPVLLVVTPLGRRTVDRLGGRRWSTLRGGLAVAVAAALAVLPLQWWIGWSHAGAFGFRTAGAVRWTLETLGGHALGIGVTLTGALVLLWLLRRWPDRFAALGTLVVTALTAALVLVQPWVVARVLYDPQPLDDPELVAAIEEVAARSSVADVQLYEADASVRTTRINALVTGIGPSRQVLLWDTLLALPRDRVVAVVGHELAHAEHRDVGRSVLASATGTFALLVPLQLWWRRRGEHRTSGAAAGAAAVAAVLVVQVLSVPALGWTSRRIEAAADHRSLELVRDPAGLVAVTRGFVLDDLADPDPPTWVRLLTTHPSPADRIEAAVAWARANGVELDEPAAP